MFFLSYCHILITHIKRNKQTNKHKKQIVILQTIKFYLYLIFMSAVKSISSLSSLNILWLLKWKYSYSKSQYWKNSLSKRSLPSYFLLLTCTMKTFEDKNKKKQKNKKTYSNWDKQIILFHLKQVSDSNLICSKSSQFHLSIDKIEIPFIVTNNQLASATRASWYIDILKRK